MGCFEFCGGFYKPSISLFKRAAAKGHGEAKLIVDMIEGVPLETEALKEALIRTEQPLGNYLGGRLSARGSEEQLELYKKSAEAACSWAQVPYAMSFNEGSIADRDQQTCLDYLGFFFFFSSSIF
jgi:hypothetical protein